MKIGFVTSSFPRFADECAGIFVLEMAQALIARGHSVEVVAPGSDVAPHWSRRPGWLGGIRAFEAPYAPKRAFQRLFYSPGAPERFEESPRHAWLAAPATLSLSCTARRLASTWDAVVSHWLVPSGLAVRHALDQKIPHLSIAHSGDVHLLGRLLGGGAIAAHVARSCTMVGCVSQDLRCKLLRLLPPKERSTLEPRIEVLPMGYDDRFAQLGKERTYETKQPVTVVCLGRLVPIKGLEVLLQALEGIPRARLLVGGDGPSRPALEQWAEQHGLDATFLGRVPPQQRPDLLRQADIYVLPSLELASGRKEGMPLGLVEAMASGLPVVASRTGGVGELVTHGETGLLATPGDARSLSQAIAKLADHPALRARLGQAAAAATRDRTWSALSARYEERLS